MESSEKYTLEQNKCTKEKIKQNLIIHILIIIIIMIINSYYYYHYYYCLSHGLHLE